MSRRRKTSSVCGHAPGRRVWAGLIGVALATSCGFTVPERKDARIAQAVQICATVETICTADADCTGHAGPCGSARCGPESGGIKRCQVCYFEAGTVCRPANGPCDLAETCSGIGVACPQDRYKQGGVCREAAGDRDRAETCSGSSPSCPADQLLPFGVVCREAAGVCDRVFWGTGGIG